jgi:hypothetical protein
MPVRDPLARFELEQEGPATVVDRAELVELGIVALRNDATVADHRRRFCRDGAREQRPPRRIDRELFRGALDERCVHLRHRGNDVGQLAQRIAKAGKVAWACVAQCNPADDALHVDGAAQRVV